LIIIVFVFFNDELFIRITLFITHVSNISDDILSELGGLLDRQLLVISLNILDIFPLSISLYSFFPIFAIKSILTISVLLLILIDLFILFLLLLLLLNHVQILQSSTAIFGELLHLC